MASAWIERRSTGDGTRYRVRYRLGGLDIHARPGHLFRGVRVCADRENGRGLGGSEPRDLAENAWTGFEIPIEPPQPRGGVVILSVRDKRGRELKSEPRRV